MLIQGGHSILFLKAIKSKVRIRKDLFIFYSAGKIFQFVYLVLKIKSGK